MINDVSMHTVDAIMRSLSDPTRRSLFERIVKAQEIGVSELTQGSEISQSAVSQHLRTLKQAGLIADRAQGRQVMYHAKPGGLEPLFDWMHHYDIFWRDRFANLKKLLKEIDV